MRRNETQGELQRSSNSNYGSRLRAQSCPRVLSTAEHLSEHSSQKSHSGRVSELQRVIQNMKSIKMIGCVNATIIYSAFESIRMGLFYEHRAAAPEVLFSIALYASSYHVTASLHLPSFSSFRFSKNFFNSSPRSSCFSGNGLWIV